MPSSATAARKMRDPVRGKVFARQPWQRAVSGTKLKVIRRILIPLDRGHICHNILFDDLSGPLCFTTVGSVVI